MYVCVSCGPRRNFFCPPLTELEVFDLAEDFLDGGQTIRQLEELVRMGWVIASSCDLQGLRRLEEVSIVVSSEDSQPLSAIHVTCQSQQKPQPENQAATSTGAVDAPFLQSIAGCTPSRCIRLLIARYWDWEASISSWFAGPPAAPGVPGVSPLPTPGDRLAKPQAERMNQPTEFVGSASEGSTSCPLAELTNGLPLICGMQLVIARTFEDAAVKYKVGTRRMAAVTSKVAGPCSSGTMPMDAGESHLHAQRVLHGLSELQATFEEPRPPVRLGRRQHKLLQPLANARVVYHGGRTGARSGGEVPPMGLAAGTTSKEPGIDHADVTTSNAPRPMEEQGVEGSRYNEGVAGSAASTEAATVHILRLTSCEGSADGMQQFLVYTKLAPGWSAASAEPVFPTDPFWVKVPPSHACGGDATPSQLGSAPGIFRWRGGPRSALQSCLGVHLDAACIPQVSSAWPTPPLPRFNCLLQAPGSLVEV